MTTSEEFETGIDRPRYCEIEGCYRKPTILARWADEGGDIGDEDGLVYAWRCEPCYNAMEFAQIIPAAALHKDIVVNP